MQSIRQLVRWLAWLPLAFACTTLFALMVMTFLDVVMRSVVNQPIEAATELTRMMMALVVFAVLPVMSFRGGHISVDLLDSVLSPRLRRARDALMSGACGILLFWPAQRCVVLAERARDYGDVTEYLLIPTFYLAWFIALATFVTAAALVARGVCLVVAPALVDSAR